MSNKKSNAKKAVLIIIALITITGIVSTTWAYVDNQRKIKAEQLKIEEEKRKAEEEKKKYTVGTSHEGKKYSYDASVVAEKLKKYDYSNNGEKIVFLTFDDGTSTTNTPKVLDILKKEGVKATFFITGQNVEYGGEKARDLIKQEFNEGHAIANHSYTHDVKKLYPNVYNEYSNLCKDYKENPLF